MKKLLSLVLVLALALSCVCVTVLAEGNEQPEVELNVWLGGPGKQADSDEVWAAFNEQLKEYLPNTTVKFTAITIDEYSEKWSKAMAAGENVDVAWFGWILDINKEISMGALTPLDDLIDQYAPDVKAELGENALAAHTINDAVYAIPCWQGLANTLRKDLQLKGDIVAAMENQNYVEELEAVVSTALQTDDLTTRYQMFYDKFEEFLASAKETNTLGLGYFYFDLPVHDKIGIGFDIGIYVNMGDDSFTLQSDYISDSDAFDLTLYQYSRLNDYWKKGYLREDYRTCDMDVNFGGGDPDVSWVADVYNAMPVYNKAYSGAEAADARASERAGFDVRLVSGGDICRLEKGYATCTVIPYTSKNPERAMMYINLMNSSKGAELYQTMVYGLEGKHYTYEGDRIVTTGGEGQADSTWPYGQWDWAIGTKMNSLLRVGDAEGILEKMQATEKNAIVLPLYNFNFDPTNVEVEIMNVTAISDEYRYLYTYDDYEARLRERNDKMMAAGYERIMAEVQAQLDAYLAANDVSWPEF
jgi:putative aldouronate transport system substrate-binding protein